MGMYNAIKKFPDQFLFEPAIKNEKKLLKYKWYIVAGMGGSHLAADLLKIWNPLLPLLIHKNYGLPKVSGQVLKDSLIIASSYSGNTQEVINVYKEAKKKNISLAVVSTGGSLLKLAQDDNIPYIQIPDTGIQPRLALGFNIKALLALIKEEKAVNQLSQLANSLKSENLEDEGKKLADVLFSHIPVIYSSEENEPIAYNWKIKLNETGKIPAFFNVFPELNHNEMTGFDIKGKTKSLSERFYFILLQDKTDDSRIQRRMETLKKLYEARNLPVLNIKLVAKDIFHKIFSNLLLADWTAYYTANLYNVDPEAVPMVEEFKKLII